MASFQGGSLFWLTLASLLSPCNRHSMQAMEMGGEVFPTLELKAPQFLLESEAPSAARDGFAMETCCATCVLNALEDEQGS